MGSRTVSQGNETLFRSNSSAGRERKAATLLVKRADTAVARSVNAVARPGVLSTLDKALFLASALSLITTPIARTLLAL
jgi:hypothetical protein